MKARKRNAASRRRRRGAQARGKAVRTWDNSLLFPQRNPNPVTAVDAGGRIVYINPAAKRLFPDLPRRGRRHPWVAGALRMDGRSRKRREILVNDRWYQQRFVIDATARCLRIYGVDITERKRAEDVLRQREEWMEKAQQLAHLGSWELDLLCNKLSWSDEVYRIFGLKPQQFGATYEAFLHAVHPDDRARVDAAYRSSLREGRDSFEIEHRVLRPSGEVRIVFEKCEHLRDAAGRIIQSIGMVHDVTERKRAMERVQRLNEELEQMVQERTGKLQEALARDRANIRRLHDVIENVPAGIIASDEEEQVIHVNKHYGELFGIAHPGALLGQTAVEVRDLLKEKFLHASDMHRIIVIGERRALVTGMEIPLKDGRILLRDYIPIFVGGAFRGHISVYRDVSKDKRVDAAKSDFMSFASHQLRTPLTAIRWALGRLRRSLPPDDLHQGPLLHLLESAHRGTKSMADTINTMLSISRIEGGTVSLSTARVPLRRLFRAVEEMLQEELSSRAQRLAVRCVPTLHVITDQKLLTEVIVNLLSNAIKYSKDRSTITLTALREGNTVRIDVKDQGAGIPPHEQDKVFEKFYRGTQAVQTLAEGSGLGLYLVSLLVQTLHGSISFVSRAGRGTTFTVRLPKMLGSPKKVDPQD